MKESSGDLEQDDVIIPTQKSLADSEWFPSYPDELSELEQLREEIPEGPRDPIWLVVTKLVGEFLFPFVLNPCRPYPPFISFDECRLIDARSAIIQILSIAFLLANGSRVQDDDSTLSLISYGLAIHVFLDKVSQAVGYAQEIPPWITRKVFGDRFIPLHSPSRRVQMAIFSFEGLLMINPIWYGIFRDSFGLSANLSFWILLGFKTFLAFFYASMSIKGFCPLWSIAGLMVKYRLLSRPDPHTQVLKQATVNSTMHSMGKATDGSYTLKWIRYGMFGPVLRTEEDVVSFMHDTSILSSLDKSWA